MKTTLALFAAIGLAASAAPASAGGIRIAFDDLNLNSEAGQKTLARRIDKAAREVCGYVAHTGSRIKSSEARTCYEQAKIQANAQFALILEDSAKGG